MPIQSTDGIHPSRKKFLASGRCLSTAIHVAVKPLAVLFLILGGVFQAGHGLAQAADQGKPLWEVGLYNIAARLPLYRGSGSDRWYAFPLPYLVYRGEILQANREGLKGIFYKKGHIETDISVYGNPPVDSDDKTREQMPELDAIVEMGPSVKWHFIAQGLPDMFYLEAAVRGTGSVGFDDALDMAYQGIHGVLRLCYYNEEMFLDHGFSFGFTAGVDWADDRFNAYFYDVPDPYARPGREAFRSGGGYAGGSLMVSAQKRLTDSLWFGFFSRWENIAGAVFEESPLVGKENNLSLGCSLIWEILVSERTTGSDR